MKTGNKRMRQIVLFVAAAVAAVSAARSASAPYQAARPISVFNLDSMHYTDSEFGDGSKISKKPLLDR